ncbi:hypothetical protein FRC10_003620 [Ceratobasidium sp. 414]|nr:hypothetical protein FRC10_003620 [Ceratobasidium sp. 414]
MSVASRNPFDLLNDDEPDPTPAPVVAAPDPAPVKKEQPAKGPSTRGGRYYQRGGGTKPAPRDDTANQEATTGEGVRFAEGRRKYRGLERGNQDLQLKHIAERGRGRGRGRGEFRGEGGRGRGRGGPRGDRPDRHSQTGKTDTEKRVNSGWGAEEGRTELAAEESGAADATADAKDTTGAEEWGAPSAEEWGAPAANEWAAPAEGGEAAKESEERPERRQREEEEEDNTMTLTEYLAKKKALEGVPSKPEGRAANEGTDSTLWKDAIQLQRDEDEDNYFVGKTKTAHKARARKEDKVVIEIDARFPPPERGRGRGGDRGRGDRGDRGRERGGRGRGGVDQPRSGTRNNEPVDVSDESAFPSLS